MRVGVQNEFELKIYLPSLTFAALLSLLCRSNDGFIDINTQRSAAANEKENEEMKMKINCYFMDGEEKKKLLLFQGAADVVCFSLYLPC